MRNESGVKPLEYKVLVKPDPVEQKTVGGIIIPDESHEREGWAQVKGTMVAKGDSAFGDYSLPEREAMRPGARVYYDKYQGIHLTGADGEEYRLMNDKNIGAVIFNEEAAPVSKLAGRKKGGMAAA